MPGAEARFDTAVFVQLTPFGAPDSVRFAGGHIRGKLRVGELSAFPFRVALSAEYTFNRAALDRELQALELRTILDYSRGRLSLIANPTLEVVTRDGEAGVERVFDLSARGAWQLDPRVALVADYFSAAGTTRHLQPEVNAHHLVFGGIELELGRGWEIQAASGHCLTSAEPWLVRTVLGFSF